MRLPRGPTSTAFLLITLVHSTIAITLDCSQARDDGKRFDLSKLGGPKTVTTTENLPPSYRETAFTIDICQRLEKTGPKGKDCPSGTRVCAIATPFNSTEHKNETKKVIPIAGDYTLSGAVGGGHFDPKWTLLKSSDSPSDREKEGIRLSMGGGMYPPKKGKLQRAVVEFLCLNKDAEDVERAFSKMEDEEDDDDKKEKERKAKEQTKDGEGGTLKFVSYEQVGDDEVLNLEWQTKYACEDVADGGKTSSSGHWGFFTWFIIIVFLAVAAYLIFGSWLNYNRYSARGWDLVPHSETLRDIPYIFKDWMRRVVNTLQGGGSRGGYSAV